MQCFEARNLFRELFKCNIYFLVKNILSLKIGSMPRRPAGCWLYLSTHLHDNLSCFWPHTPLVITSVRLLMIIVFEVLCSPSNLQGRWGHSLTSHTTPLQCILGINTCRQKTEYREYISIIPTISFNRKFHQSDLYQY